MRFYSLARAFYSCFLGSPVVKFHRPGDGRFFIGFPTRLLLGDLAGALLPIPSCSLVLMDVTR
jgi:hypothetical protein